MSDRIIRGIAGRKQIRFLGVDCMETAREAQKLHNLSITGSVLMGRLLGAVMMLGVQQKSEKELVTLKLNTAGAIKTVIVTGNKRGEVKGYIDNPGHEQSLGVDGAIDVGGALGKGTLTVIRDIRDGRPYNGTVELQNGEIATDLSYYFSQSEQVPTAMGLGVLIEPEGRIRQAGGFMVQLMPDAEDGIIDILEKNLANLPNLTDLLDMGYSIEKIVQEMILADLGPEILERQSGCYCCGCSKEKFARGLQLLEEKELLENMEKGEDIVVQCHFCNTEYRFGSAEIEKIISIKRSGENVL